MPFVPVANTAQLEIRYLLFGQRVENVLYLQNNGPVVPTLLSEMAQFTFEWCQNELLPSLSVDLILREVYATDLSTPDSASATYAPPTNPVGGVGNACLPSNVAFCVSFRTGRRGRSFRGRNFVTGIPENAAQANAVSSAFVTAVVNAYSVFGVTAALQSWTHVIVSRFRDGQPLPLAETTPVTSVLAVNNYIDSQRRRLTGRGQ